ncbi:MAG: nuclear transport factor 2 family protein [Chitinophagaceae bacterium]|nr:nuclear transport factor 2 family protein [Chitinophagaceae bacterium]
MRKQVLTEEEVIEVIKRFDEGWRNQHLTAVDAVLAPVYVYFTQSGGTFSRDSVVQTAGSPSYILQSMNRSEFKVKLYENTAVVSTRWQGKGTYKGVAFNEDQRCSITIVKRNNKAEILTEHCTPIKGNRIFH